jgi:hypothetical protein
MKINYIDKDTGKEWIDEISEINRMIGGLKKSIKSFDT